MNSLAKRERGTFADLFDWLESEFPGLPTFRHFGGTQMIRVEDYIDEGQYVLRAQLPGIDPDKDVEITIEHGVLALRAERREEKKEARRSEFRYGTFTRSVTLPAGADEESVQATYKDGVLEVTLTIKEEQKPATKSIPITKG